MLRISLAVSILALICYATYSQTPNSTAVRDDKAAQVEQLWVTAKTLEAKATLYALDPNNNKDLAGAAEDLANVYRRILSETDTAGSFFGPVYAEYLAAKERARSAPQVSQVANEAAVRFQFLIAAQNQVLIEQNKKIIQLLEAIAKKPSR